MVQQCWRGSGPRELIGVKVETLDTPPSRQIAVELRHSQPGLFGWRTIPTNAEEVWPWDTHHMHTDHTTQHMHTHICTSGIDCVIHYNATSLNTRLLLTDLVHIASFCPLVSTTPLLQEWRWHGNRFICQTGDSIPYKRVCCCGGQLSRAANHRVSFEMHCVLWPGCWWGSHGALQHTVWHRHLEDVSGGLLEVEGGGMALQSCASATWLIHEWPPSAQCSWWVRMWASTPSNLAGLIFTASSPFPFAIDVSH